ncbi:hypothetical protein SAPIO_CDS4075 [Scedosporium apiospermum]|uniref:Uncharacterized protein n=1 Tax=Pseudallescheria apiosperma TaxID=563466 RepID=A0A084G987_PSEDA|nr:uncharacterized protein SAPIO_CDS4075 [Scedosporium apiospermum]KEZ43899.1 hypothetical protein SAPIO_CDS4075 [Scedosporium apiospermum]
MRMHNSAAVAFAALSALVVPVVLAQQTTMPMWIPMVDPENAEEFYSGQEAVIQTITNQETVVAIRCKETQRLGCPTVTLTIGRSSKENPGASKKYQNINWVCHVNCLGLQRSDLARTIKKRPVSHGIQAPEEYHGLADDEELGTGLVTRSAPIDATDLVFHPIALATPLPEADSTQCDSQPAAGTTGGKSAETGASAPSTENSGCKIAVWWPGVAAVAALGLFI